MKTIYKITNPAGQIYIGQTKNLRNRIMSYKSRLGKSHRKLHASFIKFGFDKHMFDVLHELPYDTDPSTVDAYEKFYIDQFNECGFELLNIREGGIHGKPANETREIWSRQRTGRKMSEVHKQKLITINTGRTNKNKGKKVPHEKEARREWLSVGKYIVYKDEKLIGEYKSCYEAAEKLCLSSRTIHRLSVSGEAGKKGRNKGIKVLFIPKIKA